MEEIRYNRAIRVLEKRLPDHLVEECRDIVNRAYHIDENLDRVKFYNHLLSITHNKFRGNKFKSK